MNNNVMNVENSLCTGCGACYNACPINAIEMKPDKEGFLFPNINSDICTNCGLCYSKCPAVNTDYYKNQTVSDCYAVYGNSEIRMKSSSGGVFSILAEHILNLGGAVCGARWNDEWAVEHTVITTKEKLTEMRGSKYLQSDTKKVYSKIKAMLKENKQVLFSGCPCQAAGLRHYLGKNYENLFIVDILCHGVPSPKAFRKFLISSITPSFPRLSEENDVNLKDYIDDIQFRNKERYGWAHSLIIKMKNGSEYSRKKEESSWYDSFINILNCRKSCGNCRYASIPRQGDITIGDFWGIERCRPEINNDKGVSVVTLNNEKGEALFDKVSHKFELSVKETIENARQYNWNLIGSSRSHSERKHFFELLDYKNNYDMITDYALHRKFDIGFVGWWYGKNYGSALTCFAIQQYLASIKKSVLMLEWPVRNINDGVYQDIPARRLANDYYDVSIKRTLKDLPALNFFCETFLVGSDQLWDYKCASERDYYYFLDFVDDSKKKISYATSFGHASVSYPDDYLKKASFYMKRFDHLSVREKDGITICKEKFDTEAEQVVDPVFLCEKQIYLDLIAKSEIKTEKPYIFAYILNPTPKTRKALSELAREKDLDIKIVLDGQMNFEINKSIIDMNDKLYDKIEICDFVKLIYDSSFVFTDSYHGSCFSIIFEKQFLCIANVYRGLSRFESLFDELNLNNRMIFDPEHYKSVTANEIDYKKVNKKLNKEIDRSKKWLNNALNSPLKKSSSAYDILIEKIRKLEDEIEGLKSK